MPEDQTDVLEKKTARIRIIPLENQSRTSLVISEILGYADEKSPLDAGRLDVDTGIHGLKMIRLKKIATEKSDFPAFLWLPDNPQIEPEVGGDGEGVVIGRNFRLSGVEEVLNKGYLIRIPEMRRQAGGVFRKIINPDTLDFSFRLRISAPKTP